jgi:hypothetical protein
MTLSGLMSRWMMPARCSAARQLDRDIASFLQAQQRPTRQSRLEKFALVERHDRVKAGLPPGRQFDDAADPGAVHVRAHPGLARERHTIDGHGRDLGLRKFQHHLATLDLVHCAEQAGVSSVGHQHFEQKAIDRFAGKRHRDQRQLRDRSADLSRFHRRQLDHVEHQGRAIVGAAGLQRGCHQRAGGILGGRALAENVSDGLGAEEAVHTVAAQKEAVVPRHRLGGIVQPQLCLDAERAGKDVRPTGAVVPHMIGAQAGEAVTAEAISARVADVKHVGDAPAQHQRGEGAPHSRQFAVPLSLGIDPAIECIENSGRRPSHFHGLGQVAKSVEKPTHRGFGCHAAALGAANSIGDRRHRIPARPRQLRAENRAGEILVAFARSGLGGEPHAGLNAGNPLNHQRLRFRRGCGQHGS